MKFSSINPYTGDVISTYEHISEETLSQKLNQSNSAFISWRKVPVEERAALIAKAGEILRNGVEKYARMITSEMGKPISEARGEVNKCAWVCDYYAENAEEFLKNKEIETDASHSYVRYDPIGAVFAIMPWNFPFWQVFRFAAPTLTAGNTALLKHAPNVFGCATMIEEIFQEAGFPEGVFQNLVVHHNKAEAIISHPVVKAVTLTGSERAGKAVAEIAGRHLKKTVLELGGSNAFLVCSDAQIDQAVKAAVSGRMMNSGQSCIAAKRFLVADEVYDEFTSKFLEAVKGIKAGDPMSEETQIGTLARKDLADNLHRQLQESIEKGAVLLAGGKQDGCYFEPTILAEVTPEMPAFKEETFGPLAAITRIESIEEGFELAEESQYGLGISLFTKNTAMAAEMAEYVSDGACFINDFVKSDPRLPFGGTKNSGYGRELGNDGMLEFVNKKTVYVK